MTKGDATGTGGSDSGLSDAERGYVRETLDEIERMPAPPEPGAYGCAVVMFGILVLVAVVSVGSLIEVGGGTAATGLIIGGGAVVVGIALAMAQGGFTRGASVAATEAAVRTLSGDEDDRAVLLRAATLLLAHAHVSYGPTTMAIFDVDEVAPRIGVRLPLVLAVERELLDEHRIYPVFTGETEGHEPPPAT